MRKNNYGLLLVRGFTASLAGLVFISYAFSSSGGFSMASTLNSNAFFYLFAVGPSEEIIFRYFIPLVIMVFADVSYMVGGVIGGVMFGLAHYWAYGGSIASMMMAMVAGIWQAVVVWQYSMRRDGKFTFMPGLVAVMLGHGLYDYFVTTIPGIMLYVGAACALVFVLTFVIIKVEEEEA
jgi:RsiW-degrading membrane proteinase PrsW (M82 family)